MTTGRDKDLLLVERIERALVLLAYFIELDGDVHLPLFEKFEAELLELKRRESAKEHEVRTATLTYRGSDTAPSIGYSASTSRATIGAPRCRSAPRRTMRTPSTS